MKLYSVAKGGSVKLGLPAWVIVGAIVALAMIVVGLAILLPGDDPHSERFGQTLLILGGIVTALLALLRANDATNLSADTKSDTEKLTNGHLRATVESVVQEALVKHDADVHGHVRELPNVTPGT